MHQPWILNFIVGGVFVVAILWGMALALLPKPGSPRQNRPKGP